MPRSSELAVDSRGSQLREQIFVDVTFFVTPGEREGVDRFDRRLYQRGLGDHELSIRHEVAFGAQVPERFVADAAHEFLARTDLAQAAPADRLVLLTESRREWLVSPPPFRFVLR